MGRRKRQTGGRAAQEDSSVICKVGKGDSDMKVLPAIEAVLQTVRCHEGPRTPLEVTCRISKLCRFMGIPHMFTLPGPGVAAGRHPCGQRRNGTEEAGTGGSDRD